MASAAMAKTSTNGSLVAGPSGGASASASTAAPGGTTSDSVAEQLRQLDDARKLVLGNVSHYPMIVQGILPLLAPSALPALRRWGADFVAEAFATPALAPRHKESLSLLVLESLRGVLENTGEDALVLRSVIEAAASIYPLVVRWIINNSYDADTWERISAIKSRILRLWESPSPSVRICCIKFAQRVVLTQTHAANSDHKRDGLDISLSLVPPNHPLLDPRHLEAEASGLLDRMLGVLQDNSSDALIVDATLNTLSVLVRTRPSTANRTINAILGFNPLRLASSAMTPRARVMAKSMEKTTRMLLIHLTKRDPHNPQNPRILQYVERLMRSRAELLDDAGRKRQLADQQAAAYGSVKRQRLVGDGAAQNAQHLQHLQPLQKQQQQHQAPALLEIPPLGPGAHSLADVFALSANRGLRSFHASNVPLELVAKISVSTLARVDAALLARAVQAVRDRLASLETAATRLALNPDTAPLDVEPDEDDDDYEPDFTAAEDAEQILNKLDSEAPDTAAVAAATAAATTVAEAAAAAASASAMSSTMASASASSLALGAFRLPPAPPLTPEQAVQVGQATVARVFDMMHTSEETAVAVAGPSSAPASVSAAAVGTKRSSHVGLNRVAATTYDKDAWITILTRLATRSISGLEDEDEDEEEEGDGKGDTAQNGDGRDSKDGREEGEADDDDASADAYETWTASLSTKAAEMASTGKLVKTEAADGVRALARRALLTDTIREALFRFVLEDFRKRIDAAVAWLCEEWYSDRVAAQQRRGQRGLPMETETAETAETASPAAAPTRHYDTWVVRVLDGFLPYLHAQDTKVLTRFLSEVPALNATLLGRVKTLCRDPSMVPVALTSLLYQLMMRPPARELTLDTMQEIWLEFEDARPMATKYLDKWRPGFVQAHSQPVVEAAAAADGDAGAAAAAATEATEATEAPAAEGTEAA